MDIPKRYEILLGSDVAHYGMYLEMWDRSSGKLALWAFYSDSDGSFEYKKHLADVPLDLETWFRQEARRRLPPIADGAEEME